MIFSRLGVLNAFFPYGISIYDILICMEPHHKLRKIYKNLLFKITIISVPCGQMHIEVKHMIRDQIIGADKWIFTVV